MRKPLVAGNWKLNGTREQNARLVAGILSRIDELTGVDVMLCPPFVYLEQVAVLLRNTAVALGAQNVAMHTSGAFTGEVSAAMLLDIGCRRVIVGHSERRALFAESDSVVAAKTCVALDAGLEPVVCVGETLEEREAGKTLAVIERQLNAVVAEAGIERMADAALAYEPVWAIGTGHTATPDQAQEVHAHIRSILSGADARIAADLRVLYGGSVKGSNAAALLAMPDIDGGLIGGASLDAADFAAICAAAAGTD